MNGDDPVFFEGLGGYLAGLEWGHTKFFYEVVATRPPRKGEHYLSGAIPMAYRAPNDLTISYQIVKPIAKAKLKQVWVREPL